MYIVNRTCLGVFNLELIEEVPLKITMLVSYTLGTVSSWPSLNLKRTEAVFKLATYPLVLLCCCWSCALYFMYVISIILIPREFPRQQLPMQFKLEISWPYSTKLETSKFVRNHNWTKLCMPNISTWVYRCIYRCISNIHSLSNIKLWIKFSMKIRITFFSFFSFLQWTGIMLLCTLLFP